MLFSFCIIGFPLLFPHSIPLMRTTLAMLVCGHLPQIYTSPVVHTGWSSPSIDHFSTPISCIYYALFHPFPHSSYHTCAIVHCCCW